MRCLCDKIKAQNQTKENWWVGVSWWLVWRDDGLRRFEPIQTIIANLRTAQPYHHFATLVKYPQCPPIPSSVFTPPPHTLTVLKNPPKKTKNKKKGQIPLSPFLWHPIIHMTPSLKNPSSSSYGLSKIGKRTINPFQYKPPSMLTHTWLLLQGRRKACLPYPTKLSFFPKIFSFQPFFFFFFFSSRYINARLPPCPFSSFCPSSSVLPTLIFLLLQEETLCIVANKV